MFRLRSDSHDEAVEVTVSNPTVFRVVATVVAAVIILAAVQRSVHTLSLIGIALFLSLALNGPVHWLAEHLPGKWGGNRNLATGISILIVILLLSGFIAAIAPPLVRQTASFLQATPHLVKDLRDSSTPVGHFVVSHHLQNQIDSISSQLSDRVSSITGSAFATLSKIGSSLFSALTVIVLTVMMLAEGPHWRRIFEDLIPRRHHQRTKRLSRDMHRVIQGYVNGQVLLAAIASVLIVPMLFILGIPYPLALMVVIFVCGLIPMVGHTIGAIIVTAVALAHSVSAAIIILAYYILYQQIENYVVQPRIQANSTNMSPLLVFIAVILGVNFGGLLGGLVAIPVMGCIRIAVIDYLESRDILSSKTAKDVTTPGKPDTI